MLSSSSPGTIKFHRKNKIVLLRVRSSLSREISLWEFLTYYYHDLILSCNFEKPNWLYNRIS